MVLRRDDGDRIDPVWAPTFLTAMLSYGAQRLAGKRRPWSEPERCGDVRAISAINSDKTGHLDDGHDDGHQDVRLRAMVQHRGNGYEKSGTILHGASQQEPDFKALGYRARAVQ